MNYTYNDNEKTESYVYVIVIFAPILFLYLLQRCLLHTCLYCHRGTCCIEDEVDEDNRLDGFDNLSI